MAVYTVTVHYLENWCHFISSKT